MQAARKRPDLASVFTTMLPSVPQVYVNVERDKVLTQGVNLSDVYRTLQSLMGGFSTSTLPAENALAATELNRRTVIVRSAAVGI